MLLLAVSACSTPASGNGSGAAGQGLGKGFPGSRFLQRPRHRPGRRAPGAPERAPPTTKSTVEAVLNAVVGAGGQPQTGKIRTSLIDAGFPAGAVEVTASRTPTGLAADAVEAAVRDGGDCIVAQIRNGGVAVSVLPALASGGCLVGVEG